ncbi:DoxX family membrane protein [Sciscionella marina]|uniref:DoxX family membrane protein n=1 Tax=Sciscionella marina TaxID=508770 RepID=UPI000382858C|nr:DoxX family membrane protein [Sciscionella marina]
MLRRIARPLLAWVFVSGGIDTLRHPAGRVELARPLLDKTIGDRSLPVPTDPETLVKIDALVKTGAGLALGFGKCPRLAALLLAASLVPTTLAGHSYWEHDDEASRATHRIHFDKNLALLGGLLIAALDKGENRKRPS